MLTALRSGSAPTALAAGLAVQAFVAAPARGQDCLWTWHASPPGVDSGAVVYHTGLGRVVLIEGGSSGVVVAWRWDGAAWTRVGALSLLARRGFGAAYDAARDRVVVFGGRNGIGTFYPQDTWEWDGAEWAQRLVAGPPGRELHGMAYDEARQRTVLFGGSTQAAGALGDTWEFDGQQWTPAAAGGPPARVVGAFGYDPSRGRTVLLGRGTWEQAPQDLWEWDGASWVERPGLGFGAPSRWMAFDRGRGLMVVGRHAPGVPYWRSETLDLNTATGQWTVRVPDYSGFGSAAYDTARGRVVAAAGATHEFNGAGTAQPPVFREFVEGGGAYPAGGTLVLTASTSGTALNHQWFRDGRPLVDDGRITGATTPTLTVRNLVVADRGEYRLLIWNGCGQREQFAAVSVNPSCYPNCDDSTVPPILNVNDFVCFMTRFAAGDPYANCDQSSAPPMLNVNDFICFGVRFAQGCP